MTERFIAHVSKSKTLMLLLLAILFVAAGIWCASSAEEIAASSRNAMFQNDAIVRAFGWAAILFGLGGAAIVVRQLFRSGPVMEIDEHGVLWQRWSSQVIPWPAIAKAEPRAISGQQFLCLWLEEPSRYPAKSTLGKLASLNKGMGFGDIALSVQGTDQSFDRLVEAVGAHIDIGSQRVGTGSAPE